jgi:selenide,water dikinase
MDNRTTVLKDLVLIGGGHSHVAVLKSFGMRPMPGVRLTLIARDVHTPYSGMLPGFVAGHYGFDDVHVDLRPLCRFANARLYHDSAVGIDLAGRRVLCVARPPVPYDLLSIDIGSTPRTDVVPGADLYAIPVKPIDRFVAHWERLAARVVDSAGRCRIVVVGAGAGGVEILLATQWRLRKLLAARGLPGDVPEFHLVSGNPDVLPGFPRRARARFERVLAERNVTVHRSRRVVAVAPARLALADGGEIPYDELLWVTEAGAAPWLRDTGLSLDPDGFVAVDAALRSISHPEVFAAGDIAAVGSYPRPKAGVFAVRQGPPLARNLRRALVGRAPRPYAPQRTVLALISTGDRYAVATKGRLTASGRAMWRWKDRIDRRWMAKYGDLPEMEPDGAGADVPPGLADPETIREFSRTVMRCGGCGAKVGATVLARVLASLPAVTRSDVLLGLGEPDDAAVIAVPPGKVLVHTVDHFRAFIDDPYVFGQIAANHSLGDVYAMDAEPQSALAIATVPHGIEPKVEDTLSALLAGATKVLGEAGAALVGGHTGEGAELALGFAVVGLADRDRLMRKGGMKAGDALILTKPLGTGTLFAADMRGKARGRWIDGALAAMLQSNRQAMSCVRAHGATACTDVTGFGLLGHLMEMVRASRVDVVLDLGALPVLDGALETTRQGIFSTLQPANIRLRCSIRDPGATVGHPAFPLIFDPQTSGGLLASVPEGEAQECVDALRRAGYAGAAVVGRVVAGGDHPEPVTLVC